MKKYLLLIFLLITGCQHNTTQTKHVYYSAPELSGMIFFNGEALTNVNVYLLTSCDDKQAITDDTGYFFISPACTDLIPEVPKTDLGFLYQLIIIVDNQQFIWQLGGLGYGFKTANVEIDLADKQVNYQIIDNGVTIKRGITPLKNLNELFNK